MSDLDAHARHFDALYARDADPWEYATSPDEAAKRRAIGQLLGAQRRGVGLELGCGNGTSTIALAPRFARLVAVDGSARAAALAAARASGRRHVTVLHRRLPEGFPRGRFDAVVASEVLYYLPEPALTRTLNAVRRALSPGGRLVTAHALTRFDDAEIGHDALRGKLRDAFGREVAMRVGAGWWLGAFGS